MTTITTTAGRAPGEPAPGGTARPAGAASVPAAVTPGGAQAVFRAALDALARPGTVRRLPSADAEPLAGHVPAALLPLLALADLSTPACVVSEEEGAFDEVVRVATGAPRAALGEARLVAALRPLTADELGRLRTGSAAAPEDGALACLAVTGIAVVDGAGTAAAGDVVVDGANPAAARDVVVDGANPAAAGDGLDVPGGDCGPGRGDRPDGDEGRDRSSGESGDAAGASGRLWLRLSGPGVPGAREIIVTGLPPGFAAARDRLVAGFPAGADLLLIAPNGAMTGLPRTTEVHEEAI